ncbi:hypothetical protein BD289DRAFT_211687 [Coniella lustricola]|uniref:Uncharacterized protein n=1 Tax=Coniella lustricola TaxID=2025994 RepID=A0A2T2ZS73_9PEZI|nr:hypothetical protein BD289DRAFT_211687 [Coniella lustricola]
MQLKTPQSRGPALPKPQVHSRQCHHTYNATRKLPRAIWIRSLRFDLDSIVYDSSDKQGESSYSDEDAYNHDKSLCYEILLYYDHNRACTIYRSPEDFRRLKYSVGKLPISPPSSSGNGKMRMTAKGARSDCDDSSTDEEVASADESAVEDVEVLQRYLVRAVEKKRGDCALEYFLRRRMDDCGGV